MAVPMTLLQLRLDLATVDMLQRAHQLGGEHRDVVDAEDIGAERADAQRAEFLVAHRDRLRRAPFQPGLLLRA